MYQPLSFAEYWQAIQHRNQQEAKQTLQAEGLAFHSPANALRYAQAREDCRVFAKREDWTMVTAMLEEMNAIKTADQLEAMEAHYASEEYQAKQEADIEAWVRELRAQGITDMGELALALEEKAVEEGNWEYVESLDDTITSQADYEAYFADDIRDAQFDMDAQEAGAL